MLGRRVLFLVTFGCSVASSAGAAGSQSVTALLLLRLFSGAFGASSLPTCGGVISDVFSPQERGPASSALAMAAFLGPVLGPIAGGFVGETAGWRWVEGLISILAGVFWVSACIVLPETYAPVLLRRKAERLSTETSSHHVSALDEALGSQSKSERWKKAVLRPFVLLFLEPIVLALSIYIGIVYGILLMMFAAFPVVFQFGRDWSAGLSGLAFLGMAVGMILALPANIVFERRHKSVKEQSPHLETSPESRLEPTLLASVVLPLGLFLFAWLNDPKFPWILCLIASAPVGFGMVLIFLSLTNYLIDSYLIYSASVLAAASVLRSLFGAIFPLFTPRLYESLGIHWASSVPAFLSLFFLPAPFFFYKYGARIRARCPYAAQAQAQSKLLTSEPPSPSSAVMRPKGKQEV